MTTTNQSLATYYGETSQTHLKYVSHKAIATYTCIFKVLIMYD